MRITPFLMFEGRAAEAADFYVATLGGEILSMAFHGADRSSGVLAARISLAGEELMPFDSPAPHAFTFTPSISLFVDCDSEAEIRRLAAALDAGQKQFMPLGDYGFAKLFAWVEDRFGVSWQLRYGPA